MCTDDILLAISISVGCYAYIRFRRLLIYDCASCLSCNAVRSVGNTAPTRLFSIDIPSYSDRGLENFVSICYEDTFTDFDSSYNALASTTSYDRCDRDLFITSDAIYYIRAGTVLFDLDALLNISTA